MTTSIEEQIKSIEDEIFNTQKNKATEHHIGKLKAKIAILKTKLEKKKSQKAKGKGFTLKKTGDATVGIIGFPSVGKSTLLNQLTRASSKIGEYDFTTLDVIPGVLKYKGADIQLYDLPGLIEGAAKGKGKGKEILSAIRNVDLVMLLLDIQNINQLAIIEQELHHAGLRLNQKKPDVVVTKKGEGGITVTSTVKLTHVSEDLVKSISSEFVINASITIREDVTEDQLIDAFAENRIYIPALLVLNKIDLVSRELLYRQLANLGTMKWDILCISATDGKNLDQLKEALFSHLNLIRIYMKPIGKPVDYEQPLILQNGNTVEDACRKIHREFIRKFRYASVSGPSAKHEVQKVGLDHILLDRDILTIVIDR